MPTIDLSLANLATDSLTRVVHAGKKFVVVRTNATIYAYPDVCPHAFWPLSSGAVRDGVLECHGHGWQFDVRTGRCINAPDHCLAAVKITVTDEVVRLHWDDTPETLPNLCQAVPSSAAGCS